MTVSDFLNISSTTLLINRFISTQVDRFTLIFPASWVAEIVRVDRSQLLDLPFYDPLLLGIISHNSQIMPLIAAAKLLEIGESWILQERSIVIRLNQLAGELANIGIIVDRAIGSTTRSELPSEIFESDHIAKNIVLFRSELFPSNIWQPQRWNQ